MKRDISFYLKYFAVQGIATDSRKVKPGDAFFAIKGSQFDGNDYIKQAFALGAAVVFTNDIKHRTKQADKYIEPVNYSEPIIYLEELNQQLRIAAELIYNRSPTKLTGITGTNGKTSVASYVHQICTLLGKNSAAIGTLGVTASVPLPDSLPEVLPANIFAQHPSLNPSLTTPDFISNRTLFHNLAKAGVEYLVFEASSHGLQQERLGDILIDSTAFTSFSQDHLDYHHTMAAYLQAKLLLFTKYLKPEGEAVINSEIQELPFIKNYLQARKIPVFTVGSGGNLSIVECAASLNGQEISFLFQGNLYKFTTSIIGSFQATNILIAAKLVYNLGFKFTEIVPTLPLLQPVTGRLQRVTKLEDAFQIFIDYAHSPESLEKSLTELRNIHGNLRHSNHQDKPASNNYEHGKLLVLFGCGGNRDQTKRPVMGEIASRLADLCIITDDNPRYEDAQQIRQEIKQGIQKDKNIIEIGDRRQAIITAINLLRKNDILLIAGKGHEEYQIIGDNINYFSDIKTALHALELKRSGKFHIARSYL